MTEKYYSNVIGTEKDGGCWQQAFELLKEIVREERQKASALGVLGRKQEAAEYCRKWIRKEPENIIAFVAGVYALHGTRQYDEAEKLAARFIFDSSKCTEENDVMFIALSRLYEAMGRKKEKCQIDKAIEEYEERMEEELANLDDDEYSFDDWDDGDLPF